MGRQNGNALFLILIAMALFAALSYAVTQSSRGGGDINREQKMLDQAVSEQCSASVNYAVNKLKLVAGCAASEISYELADGSNANSSAPVDKSCHVFHSNGAGVSVCGAYGPTGCNLAALTLGEKCPSSDIIYAGELNGTRLYTTAADQGAFSWNNGTTSYTVTGATSTSNGKTNTDTLVGLSDVSAPYEAANACRGLGSEWYLPAKDELNILYKNRFAIGGFNTGDGGWPACCYWSSSEVSSSSASYQRFAGVAQSSNFKTEGLVARCVRR
jgi:hypothetical protein